MGRMIGNKCNINLIKSIKTEHERRLSGISPDYVQIDISLLYKYSCIDFNSRKTPTLGFMDAGM